MKQYQDEREIATAFLRILNKLYILRNLDDVPANLTFNNLCDRLISNQSLAILNPDEQDLLRLFIRHEDIYRQILSSGNPFIMDEALSKLNSYDRVVVQILRLISENRGIHPEGGYRLIEESEKRYCRKQRSRGVLAWVLRSLNISDHPVFVPLATDLRFIENTINKYKQALINVHPDYEDVILNWERDLDNIKLIISRKINQIEVPQQMFDRLSPEGEDLYEFFYCLILRQNNRLAESYLEQYAPAPLTIARQNFLWILNQKNILDDLDNPPYAVSASQVIEQLYGSDVRGLDQRSIDFLNNRRENFGLYNEIMSIPDVDEFVRTFNSLQAEDQAFISVLQSIDKFYSEHGCKNPNNDSWYSPDFYEHLYLEKDDSRNKAQRFYSNDSSESDNNEEQDDYDRSESVQNIENDNYDESEDVFSNTENTALNNAQEESQSSNEKVDDYEQAFLALLSHSKDENYDLAYNRTISILLKTGFIKDPVKPPKYDPQELFYSLTDKDNLHLVEGEDVKFLIERSLNTAIYLSIFRLDVISRQRLIDSLQSQDRGFIMALLSLEDKTKELEPSLNQDDALDNEDDQNTLNISEAQNSLDNTRSEISSESVENEFSEEQNAIADTNSSELKEEPSLNQDDALDNEDDQNALNISEAQDSLDNTRSEISSESVENEFSEEQNAIADTNSSELKEEPSLNQDDALDNEDAQNTLDNTETEINFESVANDISEDNLESTKAEDFTLESENSDSALKNEVSATVESDPLDPVSKAYNLTARILRSLDLCVDLNMDGDGSICKDLKDLFDKLYTLDSFIILEKEDQLFLYKRREYLDLFLEMQADENKLSKLEELSDDDKGFFSYIHAINFGM